MTKLRSVLLAVIAAGFITEGVAQFEPPPSDRTAVTVNNAGEVVVPANFWDVNRDEIIGGLTFEDVGGTIHPDQFVSGAGSNYFLRWTGSAWEWRTAANVRSDIGANNAGNLNTGTLPDARLSSNIPRIDSSYIEWDGLHEFVGGARADDLWAQMIQPPSLTTRINLDQGALYPAETGSASLNWVNRVLYGNWTFPDGLDANNLIGILPDARLSSNIPLLNERNTWGMDNEFIGGVFANTIEDRTFINYIQMSTGNLGGADGDSLNWITREFFGDWSFDNGLNASNLSGTIAAQRLGWTSGNNVFLRWTGSAWEWRTGAQVRSDVGANNAANLNTGMLPDARLSSNIPRLDVDNHFTASNNTFEQGLYVGEERTVKIEEAGLEGLFFFNVHAGYGVGIRASDQLTQDIWLTPPSTSGTIALTSDIPDGADKANVDFSNVTPATGRSALELTSAATGNAAGLTSGTLPGARIGTTGTNTFLRWTGSTYQWRTAADVRTDIGANNAANLNTGTLSDARLSNNIPRLDGNNTFTGSNSFTSTTVMDSISFDMGTGMIWGVDGVGYIQHLDYDNIFILSGGQSKLIIDAGVGTEERTATIQGHSGTVAYLDDIPFYRDTITVQSDAERFTLTDSEVSVGTVVSVTATGMLYMVVDIDELDNNAGYSLMNPAGNVALQMRRGTKAELNTIILAEGEPGWTTDTEELYVGTGSKNVRIGSGEELSIPKRIRLDTPGFGSGSYVLLVHDGYFNGKAKYTVEESSLSWIDETYTFTYGPTRLTPATVTNLWRLQARPDVDEYPVYIMPTDADIDNIYPADGAELHDLYAGDIGTLSVIELETQVSEAGAALVNSTVKEQREILNAPYYAMFTFDVPWSSGFTDFELKASINNFGNSEKVYYYHSPDPGSVNSVYDELPVVYFSDSGFADSYLSKTVTVTGFTGEQAPLNGTYRHIGYGSLGPERVVPSEEGTSPMYSANENGATLECIRTSPSAVTWLYTTPTGLTATRGTSSDGPWVGATGVTRQTQSRNRLALRKQDPGSSIYAQLADVNSEVGSIQVIVKVAQDNEWMHPDNNMLTWMMSWMDGSAADTDGASRSIWRQVRPEWLREDQLPFIVGSDE